MTEKAGESGRQEPSGRGDSAAQGSGNGGVVRATADESQPNTSADRSSIQSDTSLTTKPGVSEATLPPGAHPTLANGATREPTKGPLNEAHIAQLQSMFPGTDYTTITTVLRSRHGDLDSAVMTLLEMNDPEYQPSKAEREAIESAKAAQAIDQEQEQAKAPRVSAWYPTVGGMNWDPRFLHYQPRVRRPRPPPVATGAAATQRGGSSSPQDGRAWQEELNRLAGSGMARVGTTFASLKQRAGAALRHLPQEGDRPLSRRHSVGPQAQTANRHQTAARLQLQSLNLGQPGAGDELYDSDPRPVRDKDLDRLVAGVERSMSPPPASAPPTSAPTLPTKAPSWGRRYTGEKAKSTTSPPAAASAASLEGWEAVGRMDDEQPSAGKQREGAKPQKESKAQPPAGEPKERTAAGTPGEPASDEDREYVTNPFDDED